MAKKQGIKRHGGRFVWKRQDCGPFYVWGFWVFYK